MSFDTSNIVLCGWKGLVPANVVLRGELFDNSFHDKKALVQIYGSSLIRDLLEYAEKTPGMNPQLSIPGIHVVWNGNPGQSVVRVHDEITTGTHPTHGRRSLIALKRTQPDVIAYVWMGNDIDNGENPDMVAWHAIQAASMVEDAQAYICSVLPLVHWQSSV